MAKGGAKKVNQQLDEEQNRVTNQGKINNSLFGLGIQKYGGQADTDYSSLNKNFSDFYGARTPENSPSFSGLSEMASTGGVDPALRSGVEGNIADYNNFAHLGDPSGKYYKNLIDTGGFTDPEKANFRARSNSVVPAMFEGYRNNLETSANAQGRSPGYSGQVAALGRDQAHAASAASLGTEVSLADLIRQGKLAGASGAASNFLGGEQGATGAGLGLAGMIQRGKESGLQGLSSLYDTTGQQQLGALGGRTGLYSATPGRESEYLTAYLKSQGMTDADIAQLLNTKSQRNPNSSLFDDIMKGLGLGASIAAPFIPGASAGRTINKTVGT